MIKWWWWGWKNCFDDDDDDANLGKVASWRVLKANLSTSMFLTQLNLRVPSLKTGSLSYSWWFWWWSSYHYHFDDCDDENFFLPSLQFKIFKNILRYSADNIWKWNTLDYHNRYRNYLHRNYLHIKKISWKQKEFGKLGGRILLYVCLSWNSWRKKLDFLELFPTETRIMWVSDICSHLLTVSRARWYSLSAKSNSLNKSLDQVKLPEKKVKFLEKKW